MKRPTEVAILLSTLIALAPMAQAETVYRCGNTYGPVPCAGASPVEVGDARTEAQRMQTQKAAERDAQVAAEMERRRLREEQGLSADESRPSVKSQTSKKSAKAAGAKDNAASDGDRQKSKAHKKSAKDKAPEYFTVRSPTESTKKKTVTSP